MRIIVLNDGETYTNAEGCLLLNVDMPDSEDIDDAELKEVCEAHQMSEPGESLTMSTESGLHVGVEVIARF